MSRVVEATSERLVRNAIIDAAALREVLDRGVQRLTEAATPERGWRDVLGSADTVVLKFNHVGAEALGTRDVFATVLVERLLAAGYRAKQLVLVEAPEYLARQFGTRGVPSGWGETVAVGDTREELARYLFEADAVVNVPFLKTHMIAGMTGAMKNLSHALLRRPALYHSNGCSPFVGQVVGSPPVAQRLKLSVMNATRIVVRGGPDAREEDVVEYGGVLFGFDPVALDHVGLSILEYERNRAGISETIHAPHLRSAADLGVGRWHPAEIERLQVRTHG